MAQTKSAPHILPLRLYLMIGFALIALTAITVWVAQYDLGSTNLLVAMAVASAKGILVLLFFMHLKYMDKLYSLIFVVAIVVLALFVTFTMFDTLYRGDVDPIKGSTIESRAVIYRSETADEIEPELPVVPDSLSSQDNAGK